MNWLDALKETALEFQGPLVWGETDCCQLVNAYHERLTGQRFSFEYDSEMGAKRLLAEHGGMCGLLNECLGEPGDLVDGAIVVSDTEDGPTAGIFNGYCIWTMHPEEGLVRMAANYVEAAWPVQ